MADANTFDLFAALAGRGYPEENVDIYLDEKVAHEIEIADEALQILSGKGDFESYKSLEEKRNQLAAKVKETKLTLTVRGTSREDKLAMQDEFTERCKDKVKLPENRRGEEFALLTWVDQVVEIKDPAGEEIPVTEEVLRAFRLQAPDACIARIDKAIKRINTVSNGFDIAVATPDF